MLRLWRCCAGPWGPAEVRGKIERAERTFSTLPGLPAYCARLPTDPAWLVRHVLFDRVIPAELAAPES